MLKVQSVSPRFTHTLVFLKGFLMRSWVPTKSWASGMTCVLSALEDLDRTDMAIAGRGVAAVQAQAGIETGLILCGKRLRKLIIEIYDGSKHKNAASPRTVGAWGSDRRLKRTLFDP